MATFGKDTNTDDGLLFVDRKRVAEIVLEDGTAPKGYVKNNRKGMNDMDNYAFDEETVKAATEYIDLVSNTPDGGKNPLMELTGRDETDPKVDELDDFFDSFDLYSPLTDKEKEVLERGVNDEAIDKMKEMVKDAEVAGRLEEMEFLQKSLDQIEKCRAKGLRCGYIKIDKDSGEIVRGNSQQGSSPSKAAAVPTPPEAATASNEDVNGADAGEEQDLPEDDDGQTTGGGDKAHAPEEQEAEPPSPKVAESVPPSGSTPLWGDRKEDGSEDAQANDCLDAETASRLGSWYGI